MWFDFQRSAAIGRDRGTQASCDVSAGVALIAQDVKFFFDSFFSSVQIKPPSPASNKIPSKGLSCCDKKS
jgi:hypothetical protein